MDIRGRDIRAARQAAHVRQEAMAKRLGVSLATIVDIERERLVPQRPTMAEVMVAVDLCKAQNAMTGAA